MAHRAATALSLAAQLPSIRDALAWADYVAVDTEFTASLDSDFGYAPNTAAVVDVLLRSREQPQVLQVGICPFKIIKEAGKVFVKSIPMSFKTMPANPTTFSFNSSNIEFLASNGFSLDTWIQDAFPYVPISRLDERLKEEGVKTTACQYIDNINNTFYPGHSIYKDAGFSVVIKLLHELRKPLVVFVGLQDLFLIEREYVSGWDRVSAGTATTDPEEILGYLSPAILDVREICEVPFLRSAISKKCSRTNLFDMYMTMIKMQSDSFMAEASMFNKNKERQGTHNESSCYNTSGAKDGKTRSVEDSQKVVEKPWQFVVAPFNDSEEESMHLSGSFTHNNNNNNNSNSKHSTKGAKKSNNSFHGSSSASANAHDAAYDAYMTGVCFALLGSIIPGTKVPLMANRIFLWKTCTSAATHSFSDSEELQRLMKTLPFDTSITLENPLPMCVILWNSRTTEAAKCVYASAKKIVDIIGKPSRECYFLSWLKDGVMIKLLQPIQGVDNSKLVGLIDLSEFPPEYEAKVYTLAQLEGLTRSSLSRSRHEQMSDSRQSSRSLLRDDLSTESGSKGELTFSALERTRKVASARAAGPLRPVGPRARPGRRVVERRRARLSALGVVASGAVGVSLGVALLRLLNK